MKELKELLIPISHQTTGDIIKMYRKNFNLSQAQLGDLIGENQANLSKIEDNKRQIGAKTAIKFCAIFNLTLEDLLYPNGIENEEEYIDIKEKAKQLFSA